MAEPEETWETQLADLTLDPAKAKVQNSAAPEAQAPTAPTATPSAGGGTPPADTAAVARPDAAEPAPVDAAIRQALQDPKERQTVLKVEDLVERFLDDVTRDVLEFPPVFSNYQRMLAHRIAQHYGLQTSTVDYEEGQGRVIASRTKFAHVPVVRLATLDLGPNTRTSLHPTGSSDGGGSSSNVARLLPLTTERPRLLTRPGSNDPLRPAGSNGNEVNGQPVKTVKEREEEYVRARERLLGHLQQSAGGGSGGEGAVSQAGSTGGDRGDSGRMGPRGNGFGPGYSNGYNGGGRGMLNGHGNGYAHAGMAGGVMGSRGGDGGRGGGRKAVFKDKAADLQDPDYRRGINRFNGQARIDPNFVMGPTGPGGIYSVPTYSSEFPTLQQHPGSAGNRRADYSQQQQQQGPWSTSPSTSSSGGGGNSWRPPPPPPPNQQALHGTATALQAQQHAGKAGGTAAYGMPQAGGHMQQQGMVSVHPAAAAAQRQQVAFMRATPPMQASGMPAAAYGTMAMSPMSPYAGMPMAMSYAMPGGAAMPAGMYPAYPGYGQMGVNMAGMSMATPYGYVTAGPDGSAMAMSPTAGGYAMYAPYPPGAGAMYGARQVGMGVGGPAGAAVPGVAGAASVNGVPMGMAMRPGGGAMGVYGMAPMHPAAAGAYGYEQAAYAHSQQAGMMMHTAQAQHQHYQQYDYVQQQHHPHTAVQHSSQAHVASGTVGRSAAQGAASSVHTDSSGAEQ